MGGCIGKALPEPMHPVRPFATKRFDIFVSHHQGADGGGAANDFSEQFGSWIAELCQGMGLKVLYDRTNLGRILDERRLRDGVASSRAVLAIVNGEALQDPHGMQQELHWASGAKLPIVPFYDGDRYAPEAYVKWQKKYSFALQRPPVVYRRRNHMRVKDALTLAIHDALLESQKSTSRGSKELLPEAMVEKLAKQEARRQRRERRVERQKHTDGRDGPHGVSAETFARLTGGDAATDEWALPDLLDLPKVQAGHGIEYEDVDMEEADAVRGNKRFRFRDDALMGEEENGPKGVKQFLKSLADPLGTGKQEMRTAIIEGRGDAAEEQRRFVPRHLDPTLKPRSCLKKGPGDAAPRFVPPPPQASAITDPRLQKGVARLLEYLQAVKSKDMTQLPTVCRVLELAVPNEDVAARALAIIFDYVQASAESRRMVVQHGGIKHTVQAMTQHTLNLDLQTYACGCLYALSCFRPDNPDKDNNSAAIAHAGGIRGLVEAMSSFQTCREVQQFGAGALRHLAIEMRGNTRREDIGGEQQLTMRGINKRMIAKTGGIEMIAKAMQKFPTDYELQENGCAALSNLTTTSADTKMRAARAGCIRAVVNTMKSFPDEPELQQMACNVLRSLALGMLENKIAIVAQGGVKQLCKAMTDHLADTDVVVQAVAALTNLTSQVPENKRAICDAGGLQLTVAALRAQPDEAELQQHGMGLLHNLACDKVLRLQVLNSGAIQVAEVACAHTTKSVQSLGSMLLKQLQGESLSPDGTKNGAPASVDGLFAARRPGQTQGTMRAKKLSKSQSKVMRDALASIRHEDLSGADSSGTSRAASDGPRRQSESAVSSEPSDGAWNAKRRDRAAEYGIDDLEGLSDAEDSPDRRVPKLDFVVRRGLAKQAGTMTPRQDHGSLFVVRRRSVGLKKDGTGNDSARSGSQDSDFVVRRGGGAEVSGDNSARSNRSSSQDSELTEQSGFVVRRGSPKHADSQALTTKRASPQDVEPTTPTSSAIWDPSANFIAAHAKSVKNASARAQMSANSGSALEEMGPGVAPGQIAQGQKMLYPWEVEAAAIVPLPRAARGADQAVAAVAQAPADATAAIEDVGDDGVEGHYSNTDAVSVISSDASEGGIIDIFDDPNAKARLERRTRRDNRRDKDRTGGEGAQIYGELLDLVDLEEVQAPPLVVKKRPLTKAQKKFLKALRKCGEHAPDRDNGEWKEVLKLQHEANKLTLTHHAVNSTTAAGKRVLDNLDGLARKSARGVGRQRDAAVQGVKDTAAGARELAARAREEGLVQVVQTSRLARRFQFGLDDDEDSIYDLDELGQVGEAEAALLDAIGNAEVAHEEAQEQAEPGPRAAGRHGAAPIAAPGSYKLQAVSKHLAQKRQERRLVQLL